MAFRMVSSAAASLHRTPRRAFFTSMATPTAPWDSISSTMHQASCVPGAASGCNHSTSSSCTGCDAVRSAGSPAHIHAPWAFPWAFSASPTRTGSGRTAGTPPVPPPGRNWRRGSATLRSPPSPPRCTRTDDIEKRPFETGVHSPRPANEPLSGIVRQSLQHRRRQALEVHLRPHQTALRQRLCPLRTEVHRQRGGWSLSRTGSPLSSGGAPRPASWIEIWHPETADLLLVAASGPAASETHHVEVQHQPPHVPHTVRPLRRHDDLHIQHPHGLRVQRKLVLRLHLRPFCPARPPHHPIAATYLDHRNRQARQRHARRLLQQQVYSTSVARRVFKTRAAAMPSRSCVCPTPAQGSESTLCLVKRLIGKGPWARGLAAR
eukprot:TRINITY_DN22176_c0_g1_i1.p1 TRINITY_DN22176_c0_g1~~TRINITY_DN22176_c0_g1_i1.p1  ORF type:complete len:378 (+),score=-45.20 TRINITY_DN22176_c0_g1_i1:276-1409(+)